MRCNWTFIKEDLTVEKCDNDAVCVNLTIPADMSINADTVQEVIGQMERYCQYHYTRTYGEYNDD